MDVYKEWKLLRKGKKSHAGGEGGQGRCDRRSGVFVWRGGGGGSGRVGRGGQGGCVRRSEAFLKIQNMFFFVVFFFLGGV